jgi:hypothetical protein
MNSAEESLLMFIRRHGPGTVLLMAAVIAASTAVALAAGETSRSSARETKDDDALTVGALAQLVVFEIAIEPPVAGYDEFYSLRVMGAFGYETSRGIEQPARMGDLREMLSSLGLEGRTGSPDDALSRGRATRTLSAVRDSLPKVRVPEGKRRGERVRKRRVHRPGPCLDDFHQCRRDCLQKSPSGRSHNQLGSCMRRCQRARKSCQANEDLSFTGP